MVHHRRDINSIEQADLDLYIHALNILRDRSSHDPDDESGYEFQAALHNDSEIGPCEHGNDLFMPWHRAHLYYFERLLQESDPPRTAGVTIPYWDWLHAEAGRRKFPERFYLQGLHESDRDEESEGLPPDTLDILIDVRDQLEFAGYPKGSPDGDYGKLELGPHNFMHPDYIGGKMAHPSTAALDPIYWSFHCFIDLLWDEWQRRNGDPILTSPDAPLRGFDHLPMSTAGSFRRTAELDYDYELNERLTALFARPSPDRFEANLLWAGSLRPLFAESIAASLRESAKADFSLPARPSPGRRYQVRLDALKVPLAGSYTLTAFLRPRGSAFDPRASDSQRWFVGYVSLWLAHPGHGGGGGHDHGHGGHHPQPHHPSSATVRFDVTDILRKHDPEEMILTLVYRPARSQPAGHHGPAELIKEVEVNDVLLEVLG